MERGVPVKRGWIRILLAAALWSAAACAQRHDVVVLIDNAGSNVTSLSSVEVRKLFMGLTVMRGGHALRALRNDSDRRLEQIFLQNVVAMSDTTYERRVLGLALRQGRAPPPAAHSVADLLRKIAHDPELVSFAWASDVAGKPGIRIIRTLWQE